jgi:hypothetical protein
MGALKGSISYLRFVVEGEPPNNMASKFERAIEARRFRGLTDDSQEAETNGWAPIEDPFDDDMALGRDAFLFGDLIALAYREDKIALPRPMIVSLTRRRLEEMAQRGDKIDRKTRRNVELAVAAELRRKVLPRPRFIDLVWDHVAGELRVFGRGPMATERAVGLFELTFGVRARLAHYGARAFTVDLNLRAKGVLENIGPEPVFAD